MVKVTRDESFFSKTEMVAEATGCLDRVSKATPFILPFFWAEAQKARPRNAKTRHKFLINCIIYSYESILTGSETRLIRLGLLLKNVNEAIWVAVEALIEI